MGDNDPPDKLLASNNNTEITAQDTSEVTNLEIPQADGLKEHATESLIIDTEIGDTAVKSPSPPTHPKNENVSPQTPTKEQKKPHTPSSPSKDYRLLYHEVKKRLFSQAETSVARFQNLEKKYKEELEKQQLESRKREAALVTDNDLIRETLHRKDDEIKILKENIISITKSRNDNRDDYETMINEHNKAMNEKDKVIEDLKKRLSEGSKTQTCIGLKRVGSDEECIRLKPKRTTKVTKMPVLKCESEDCSEKDVDVAKCNICSKWVCESCNDVPVAKLKPVMNKCKGVYFICKECNENVGTKSPSTEIDGTVTTNAGNADLLSSLQKMFDKKVSQLESKIEKSIEKKLGDKMDAVNSLTQKITDHEKTTTEEKKSYAKILNVPTEVRKIMQETRNDEKVELIEQEKRCQNFIIHGAEEVGDSKDEIDENDEKYINDILKHMNIKTKPDSITRLGQVKEGKARVLKIVMPNKAAKEEVMANLRRLKNTEGTFGKISVTEDYTSTERQKIREFSERAREQCQQDPSRVFKVRGDPKNGLRIISFKKN